MGHLLVSLTSPSWGEGKVLRTLVGRPQSHLLYISTQHFIPPYLVTSPVLSNFSLCFLFFFSFFSFGLLAFCSFPLFSFYFPFLMQELVKASQWWHSSWKEDPTWFRLFWNTFETLLRCPSSSVMGVDGHPTSWHLGINIQKKAGRWCASAQGSGRPWHMWRLCSFKACKRGDSCIKLSVAQLSVHIRMSHQQVT